MPSLPRNLVGGIVIIMMSLLIGILHNSVRSRKIPLILKVGIPSYPDESGSSENQNSKAPPSKDDADSALAIARNFGQSGESIITISEAKKYFESKEAIFIDARSEKAYSEGHILGSINVPYDKLPSHYDQLTSNIETDQHVICYCWSPSCDFSDNLASELRLMGYENVFNFKGGWEEWTDRGYPTESGMHGAEGNQ